MILRILNKMELPISENQEHSNSNGVSTGDMDDDWDQDLDIINISSPYQLLRDNDGKFVELPIEPQNVTDGYAPTSRTFGGVDGDGHVHLSMEFAFNFTIDLELLVNGLWRAKLFMNKVRSF